MSDRDGSDNRAKIGRTLQTRLGRVGENLNNALGFEERQHEAGLRDEGEPSYALTEIRRELLRAEFTPDERMWLRLANSVDVLTDLGVVSDD